MVLQSLWERCAYTYIYNMYFICNGVFSVLLNLFTYKQGKINQLICWPYSLHFLFVTYYYRQARKIHFHFWSSEDDKDSKSGRPQLFVVVLKCISLAKQ